MVIQMLSEWESKPTTVTGEIYADLARKLYPRRDAIWQDDGASIHRTAEVLEVVDQKFIDRIPVDRPPKKADFPVIENVWDIVKEKVKAAEPQNKETLRKIITKAWKDINSNKPLLLRLMSSISKRI